MPVAAGDVVGERLEDDEAAAQAHGRVAAVVVGRQVVDVAAHQPRDAALPVEHEDVGRAVGVAGSTEQIGGRRLEGDVAAVAADRRDRRCRRRAPAPERGAAGERPPMLTRSVLTAPASSKTPSPSASRSCTKTSMRPLVSPGTRLVARDWKAMKRPVALIAGLVLSPPSALRAAEATLTRRTAPVGFVAHVDVDQAVGVGRPPARSATRRRRSGRRS